MIPPNPYCYLENPAIPIKTPFPYLVIQPIQVVSKVQWASESQVDWHCFDIYLLPQNMDRDKSAHNHLFPITLTQKTGVFQVVASDTDVWNQNNKSYIYHVHWGITTHPPKNTTPLFLAKFPLKSANCPSPPFLGNPSYILVLHEPSPKSRIFQWTPLSSLKFFILNTILSFKSN